MIANTPHLPAAFSAASTLQQLSEAFHTEMKERGISVIDMSKVKTAASSEEYLAEIVRISDCVKARGFQFYMAEKFDLSIALIKNPKLHKTVSQNRDLAIKVDALLQSIEELPVPQNEFFPHHPSKTPDNVDRLLDELSKNLIKFLPPSTTHI